MGLSRFTYSERRDSEYEGPSDVCDDSCPDEAEISKIVFDGKRKKCEVDQLCDENWSSTLVKILIGELRSFPNSTDLIRRKRGLLFLHFVRRVDIRFVDGCVGSYYVQLEHSIYRRSQEIERINYREAICDCVYDEDQASELSIAPRVMPRVDFAPLPTIDALSTAAECTEPTDQLSSAVPNYSSDTTIAQS